MKKQIKQSRSGNRPPMPVGVIGLGLMGTSITTCLLAAEHPVIAIDKDISRRRTVRRRVHGLLREMRREKLVSREPARLAANLTVANDFGALRDTVLVIECIF